MFNSKKELFDFIKNRFKEKELNVILNFLQDEKDNSLILNPIELIKNQYPNLINIVSDKAEGYLKLQEIHSKTKIDVNNVESLEINISYNKARKEFEYYRAINNFLKNLEKYSKEINFVSEPNENRENIVVPKYEITEIIEATKLILKSIEREFFTVRKKRNWKSYLIDKFRPLYKKYEFLKPIIFSRIVFPQIMVYFKIPSSKWKVKYFAKDISYIPKD